MRYARQRKKKKTEKSRNKNKQIWAQILKKAAEQKEDVLPQ